MKSSSMWRRDDVSLFVFLVVIALLHYLGLQGEWYFKFPWYDIPMHLLGGAWIAVLFFYVAENRLDFTGLRGSPLLALFLVLASTALFGVLWELYEYFADAVIFKKYPLAQNGVPDTMADFVNDLIGSAIVFSVWIFRRK